MYEAVIDWLIEQCFTSPPTQYRLYGRRFLQVKRPNQQYQSTEGEAVKLVISILAQPASQHKSVNLPFTDSLTYLAI